MESSIDEGFEVPPFEAAAQPAVKPRSQTEGQPRLVDEGSAVVESSNGFAAAPLLRAASSSSSSVPSSIFVESDNGFASSVSSERAAILSLSLPSLPDWSIALTVVFCVVAMSAALFLVCARPKGGLVLVGGTIVLGLCLLGIGLVVGLPLAAASSPVEVAFRSARVSKIDNATYVTTVNISNDRDIQSYRLDPADAGRVEFGWRISGSLMLLPSGVASLKSFKVLSQTRSALIAYTRQLVVYFVTVTSSTQCDGKPCTSMYTEDVVRGVIDSNPNSVRKFYYAASGGLMDLQVSFQHVSIPRVVDFSQVPFEVFKVSSVSAHNHLFVLPREWPTINGRGGAGELGGKLSWFLDCTFKVIAHEVWEFESHCYLLCLTIFFSSCTTSVPTTVTQFRAPMVRSLSTAMTRRSWERARWLIFSRKVIHSPPVGLVSELLP